MDGVSGKDSAILSTVTANVLFGIIEKKAFTSFDFYKKLQSLSQKTNMRTLQNEEGLNLLHGIVKYERIKFLPVIVNCNLWVYLISQSAPPNSSSSYRGHTPKQIAQSKSSKKLKEALEEQEKLVASLSPFLTACHNGDLTQVQGMLQNHQNHILEKDYFENNCLHWTIVINKLDIFELLLDFGADPQNLNKKRENLLHVVCYLGHCELIPVLMTRCQLDANARCVGKQTPLDRVADNGDVQCLKALLQFGVPLPPSVLAYAAASGRMPFLKYVLEEDETGLHIDATDLTGRTALIKASSAGHVKIVEYLIGKGASVNCHDLRKRTALHVACEFGHQAIVVILLDRGAELDVHDIYTGAELCFLVRGKDKGRKAWHYVEVRRNVVVLFLQKTRAGQVDVANFGVVVKSGWGEDPERNIVDWVEKFLSDRKDNANAPADVTPLNMAIYKQHKAVAKILIERNADINSRDQFGLTPFMLCALRNDTETAALLESKGADALVKDAEGKTALDIATLNNQIDMVQFIKSKDLFLHIQHFLSSAIGRTESNLTQSHMESLRSDGKDLRRHIIDTARELTIDVNIFLMDIGSGPVMKASENQSNQVTNQAVRVSEADQQPSSFEENQRG